MDEYVALPRDHAESYHSFMWSNLFSHIDIDPANVNLLDGNAGDGSLMALEAEVCCMGSHIDTHKLKVVSRHISRSSTYLSRHLRPIPTPHLYHTPEFLALYPTFPARKRKRKRL
jgi:hypothetical protein